MNSYQKPKRKPTPITSQIIINGIDSSPSSSRPILPTHADNLPPTTNIPPSTFFASAPIKSSEDMATEGTFTSAQKAAIASSQNKILYMIYDHDTANGNFAHFIISRITLEHRKSKSDEFEQCGKNTIIIYDKQDLIDASWIEVKRHNSDGIVWFSCKDMITQIPEFETVFLVSYQMIEKMMNLGQILPIFRNVKRCIIITLTIFKRIYETLLKRMKWNLVQTIILQQHNDHSIIITPIRRGPCSSQASGCTNNAIKSILDCINKLSQTNTNIAISQQSPNDNHNNHNNRQQTVPSINANHQHNNNNNTNNPTIVSLSSSPTSTQTGINGRISNSSSTTKRPTFNGSQFIASESCIKIFYSDVSALFGSTKTNIVYIQHSKDVTDSDFIHGVFIKCLKVQDEFKRFGSNNIIICDQDKPIFFKSDRIKLQRQEPLNFYSCKHHNNKEFDHTFIFSVQLMETIATQSDILPLLSDVKRFIITTPEIFVKLNQTYFKQRKCNSEQIMILDQHEQDNIIVTPIHCDPYSLSPSGSTNNSSIELILASLNKSDPRESTSYTLSLINNSSPNPQTNNNHNKQSVPLSGNNINNGQNNGNKNNSTTSTNISISSPSSPSSSNQTLSISHTHAPSQPTAKSHKSTTNNKSSLIPTIINDRDNNNNNHNNNDANTHSTLSHQPSSSTTIENNKINPLDVLQQHLLLAPPRKFTISPPMGPIPTPPPIDITKWSALPKGKRASPSHPDNHGQSLSDLSSPSESDAETITHFTEDELPEISTTSPNDNTNNNHNNNNNTNDQQLPLSSPLNTDEYEPSINDNTNNDNINNNNKNQPLSPPSPSHTDQHSPPIDNTNNNNNNDDQPPSPSSPPLNSDEHQPSFESYPLLCTNARTGGKYYPEIEFNDEHNDSHRSNWTHPSRVILMKDPIDDKWELTNCNDDILRNDNWDNYHANRSKYITAFDVIQKKYPNVDLDDTFTRYQTVPRNSIMWDAARDTNCENGWHLNKMIMVTICYRNNQIQFTLPLCYMVNGALPGTAGTIVCYYNAQSPYSLLKEDGSVPRLVAALNILRNYAGRLEETGVMTHMLDEYEKEQARLRGEYQEPPKSAREERYKKRRGHYADDKPKRKSRKKRNGHQQRKKRSSSTTTSKRKKKSKNTEKEVMDIDISDEDQ